MNRSCRGVGGLLLLGLATAFFACGRPASSTHRYFPAEPSLSLGVVLPGPANAPGFNSLAMQCLKTVARDSGLQVGFIENVAESQAAAAMQTLIDSGFTVIWAHGLKFDPTALELARRAVDQVFIIETDTAIASVPPNVWLLDRNYHYGYYVLGRLAGRMTRSRRIGYIGGRLTPYSSLEVRAAQQALKDLRSSAVIYPVWAHDYDDTGLAAVRARQLIASKVDFIMCSMDRGAPGIFHALDDAPKPVWGTTKFIDNSSLAPDCYVTSFLLDYFPPISHILARIASGERGGYFEMEYGRGLALQQPLRNAPPELETEIRTVIEDIRSDRIRIEADLTEIHTAPLAPYRP